MQTKEEYVKTIKNLIEETEELKQGYDNEIIYQIEDISVYGGYELGRRGVDHNILIHNDITWKEILEYGTLVVPESDSYISDKSISFFEELGYKRVPLNDNHYISSNDIEKIDNLSVVEAAYKSVCEFSKSHYEEFIFNNDGSITYSHEDGISEKYDNYEEMFNYRFDEEFYNDLKEIFDINEVINIIGLENVKTLINNNHDISEIMMSNSDLSKENIKELDLDNDGTPDRIDVDDTRNSVQTVSDLDIVNNKTDKNSEEYIEEIER